MVDVSMLQVNDAVHCHTVEEAEALMKALTEAGIAKWYSGDPLLGLIVPLQRYGEETYYSICKRQKELRVRYGLVRTFRENGGLILYEFADLARDDIVPVGQSNEDFMKMLEG